MHLQALLDAVECRRPNRGKLPQERTPHRMQPQVAGCYDPATPFRSLKVPVTAVAICLTALWPAKWRCGAVLDAVESRRLKRGKLPQERTLRRVQPQVDGCCALTTPCGSVNAPGIAVAIRLRALWPA